MFTTVLHTQIAFYFQKNIWQKTCYPLPPTPYENEYITLLNYWHIFQKSKQIEFVLIFKLVYHIKYWHIFEKTNSVPFQYWTDKKIKGRPGAIPPGKRKTNSAHGAFSS